MLAFLVFLIEGEGVDGYWLFYETGTMVDDGLGALNIPKRKFVSEGFAPNWESVIALLVLASSLFISRNKP